MSGIEDYSFDLGFFEGLHKRMPKDIRVVSILAQLYTKTEQIDLGLKMDRKLVRLSPHDPVNHYNLACSLALKNRALEAIGSLKTAIQLGYSDLEWMRNDPDLEYLHDFDEFLNLIEELSR